MDKVQIDLEIAESIATLLLQMHKALKPITEIEDRRELNRAIVKLKVAIIESNKS